MLLLSDIARDGRHQKPDPGSYEWWYFDGVSDNGEYRLFIIFYDGCPFSTRYIRNLENMNSPGKNAHEPEGGKPGSGKDSNHGMDGQSLPDQHPAIRISVYRRDKPVFYSFSQYPEEACSFETGLPSVIIGDNSFRFSEREKHGALEFAGFDLRVNELLPTGEELKGIITFQGLNPYENLFSGSNAEDDKLIWNLAMPRGRLQCRMNLMKNGLIREELKFDGTGYHDHSIGRFMMKDQFRDWYWGRAHFPQATLIYHVWNRAKKEQEVKAWLLSPDNRRLLHTLELVSMKNRRTTAFLMRPARRFHFRDNELNVSVLHHKVIDSGPYYCRYITSVNLDQPSLGSGSVQGFGEYIRPRRIHRRILWPFVHLKLRYPGMNSQWAQDSTGLKRRTW